MKAAWPAIIDKDSYDRAQEILNECHLAQSQRLSNRETRVFFASGVLKCPECGAPYFGTASHGKTRVHRYYSHRKLAGVSIECQVKRIPAESLEQDILRYIEIVLRRDGYLDGIEMNLERATHSKVLAYVDRLKFLKGEETRLNGSIGKTFELHRSQADVQAGMDLIRQELSRLSEAKKSTTLEIQELEAFIYSQPAPRDIRRKIEEGMVEFQHLWKKSTGSQKKRLLATLFESIFVYGQELHVLFNGSTAAGEKAQSPETKRALESVSKAQSEKVVALSDFRSCASDQPLRGERVENACVVKVGRGNFTPVISSV